MNKNKPKHRDPSSELERFNINTLGQFCQGRIIYPILTDECKTKRIKKNDSNQQCHNYFNDLIPLHMNGYGWASTWSYLSKSKIA